MKLMLLSSRTMRWVPVLLLGILLGGGCWFDSRSLMQPGSQRAAAKSETPKLAQPERPSSEKLDSLPAFRVRVHVSRVYSAENQDAEARIQETVTDANAVLGPALGARLTIVDVRAWAPPEGSLAGELAALTQADPGKDVDWVVGFTGSLSRLVMSFTEIGIAETLGQHLVMRAVNDAAEFDDIERRYAALPEVERAKLREARKRHKAALVLLHELGHTLGAPHARDGKRLMVRRYDDGITGFAPAELRLLRIAIAHRRIPSEERDPRGLARALLSELDQNGETWIPEERATLVARLRAMDAEPNPVAELASPATATQLSGPDKKKLERATSAAKKGRLDDAWREAEPLFEKHPADYATQELRCRLAMGLGLDFNEVSEHCAPFRKLSPPW